jgi:fatty-acyl-CoA synthase
MIQSMNIACWVQRWSELHPDKPAVIFEGDTINYACLHRRANKTSCWLQAVGIEKGDRVAVMLNNGIEFIEIFLACSRLGAIFVPLNARVSARELDYYLRNSRPRLFIYEHAYGHVVNAIDLKNILPPMVLVAVGACENPDILNYKKETTVFQGKQPFLTKTLGPSDPEEPQVIMYTSGTTGQPKGTVLSHRKTFFNCLNADIFFQLHFDDIMLIFLPLYHSGGLFIQASPAIYKGATMVIHSRFEPLKVYNDIEKYCVTKLLGVPTVYRALIDVEKEKRRDISSLKTCAAGGEKITPELIRACHEAGFGFRQIMGQTETSILLWASEADTIQKPGTVGKPVFHAEVSLMGRDGKAVQPGDIGELVVKGSIMMKEYWRDPDKTDETIKNGFLHTGDLAYMDEDGYYYLVDRVDDMYISGGENVYPAEVESVLAGIDEIREVAVVGVPDDVWGEVGHAFIISKNGADLGPEDVVHYCQGRLAKYKWPKHITFRKDFPRTSLGKVRKDKLRSSKNLIANSEQGISNIEVLTS